MPDMSMSELASHRVELIADVMGVEARGGTASVRAVCHNDKDPASLRVGAEGSADGFPLIMCHARGCDYATIRTALIGVGVKPEVLRRSAVRAKAVKPTLWSRATAFRDPSEHFVPDDIWVRQFDALQARPDRLKALATKRGITDETLRETLVGWTDADGGRYTLPVFDADGRCVGIRKYSLVAKPKMKGLKGFPQRLFIPGDVLLERRRTVYCAGEWDAVIAYEHGWQSVTHTGGEGASVPTIDLHRLAGQDVTIVYDNDEAGIKGAEKVAKALVGTAKRVAVAQLPLSVGNKGDVTDLLRAGGSLRGVVDDATPWAADKSGLATWTPQDLRPVLSGEIRPLEPTVGRRAGSGIGLFYEGKTHAIVADSEAGKTWLALLAAAQEIENGNHVFFYDFEDDAVGVVGRLQAMHLSATNIADQFHYVRPDEPLTDAMRVGLIAQLKAHSPTLVIVDGVTEVMSQHGWGQKDNDDIAAFYRRVLRPMADTGAAVVALDHLPKYDEKGRGAIGGVHKLNGIDGAAYRLVSVNVIAPGKEGLSSVTIDKDRPGQVKRHQDEGKRIADLIVDSDEYGVLVSLELPNLSPAILAQRNEKKAGRQIQRHEALKSEVTAILASDPGLTQSKIVQHFTGSGYGTETVKAVVAQMVMAEVLRIELGPRNSQLHFVAEPPNPTEPDTQPG